MSASRLLNSDKPENVGTTIGFKFHANDEELEEVSAKDHYDARTEEDEGKPTAYTFTPETINNAKTMGDGASGLAETITEQKNFLGKRSISVDSAYDSPFSNPIDTWKKFNVLKEKLTKTMEEKIFDRNVLSKSSLSRLSHSKENSSISDSEDTSESSKMSDQWRNTENQISNLEYTSNENLETYLNTSDPLKEDVKILKQETETKESENDLRKRKSCANSSDSVNIADIKIATAKSHMDRSLDENMTDIESGVEADENLETTEGSLDISFNGTLNERGGSNDPPSGGNSFFHYIISLIISQRNTLAFLLGCTLYLFFPLSEFFRGFLLSLLLIILWEMVKSFVQLDDSTPQQRAFPIPDYKNMPPLKVPPSIPAKGVWFNEYEQEIYDPDYYSVTQTVPAYVELEESILKVSRPKGKIRRRATYDEPEYKLPIISQRVYNISGCNVYLMPDGLTRKRLFSKKYPIVIFMRRDSLISEKKDGKETEEKEEGETEESFVISPESPKSKGTLYLFARCDRQKEEWYWRLKSAALRNHRRDTELTEDTDNETEKMMLDESPNKEPSTPFENLVFDNDVAQTEEYFHYMTNFVNVALCDKMPTSPSSRKLKKLKKKDSPVREQNLSRKNPVFTSSDKKSKCSRTTVDSEGSEEDRCFSSASEQVNWFNAFLNRILFDVFRSPYWHSKIQEKLHRKLNSIRLPYYIEDIEVVEMDLGKTGPMFHRVSEPYIDERGLWFDMDLTFEGLIRLTIQTHLNLIKLQKGMEEKDEMAKQTSEKQKGKKSKSSTESSHGETKKENPSPELACDEQRPRIHSSLSKKELIEEVAHLAEIAVEESLQAGSKHDAVDGAQPESSKNRSPIYDSDLEDSAESSDEDEEEEEPRPPPTIPAPLNTEEQQQNSQSQARRYPKNRRSSKRIFKVFENVAQSKYFRSVAQSKYIQKAIAGVSAARLRLALELRSCTGVLTINVPPPPSDRFWCGFRYMPKLVFSANPKIGDKSVRFVHIRNYLQKKILHELKKVMVIPNMIDFVLPTSAPARSSSSPQVEESDRSLQETPITE